MIGPQTKMEAPKKEEMPIPDKNAMKPAGREQRNRSL